LSLKSSSSEKPVTEELHPINSNLGAITKEKQEAKTAEQVINILVKTRTNEFIPHHEIQQINNQVIQQQKHLEMEKDMGWV
jgi:hypothetical protein